MATDHEIRCRVVRKLVRDNVTGSHKVTVDTAKRVVATSDRGRAETVIRELVREQDGPLEGYITIEPNMVLLPLGGNWAIGTGSTLVTTAVVMALVTAWMIRATVHEIEGQI